MRITCQLFSSQTIPNLPRNMRCLHTAIRFPTALILLAIGISLTASTFAAVPPLLKEDGESFTCLGQTTFRWKSILKVYDIAFHLGTGQAAAKALTDIPMRLELIYHRPFTSDEIIKGGDTVLRRNVEKATFDKLSTRLAELNSAYVDVKPGDAYALTYVPGRGTSLRLNGKVLATIPGHDFAASYFSIWLGKAPISDSLRQTLLGR